MSVNEDTWAIKDFVFKFPQGNWVYIGSSGGYTIPGAKRYYWEQIQQDILPQLQKWTDQGWKPITEIGPGAITLKQYKTWRPSFLGVIMALFFVIGTYGLGLFILPFMVGDWYADPVEFRVKFRRRKKK